MKKIIFLLSLVLVLGGCSSDGGDSSFYEEEGGQMIEIGNPYSSGSGHYAGYEWAERTGGSCNGNSNSFDEGCEEYYRQSR